MVRPQKVEKASKEFPGKVKPVHKKKRRKGAPSKWKKRAIKEIKALAKRTTPMVPRAVYERLCKSIGTDSSITETGVRWTKDAIDMVAAATEAYGEAVLAKAAVITASRGRETLSAVDLKTAVILGQSS